MLWVAVSLLVAAVVLVLAALWMVARGSEEMVEMDREEYL